MDLADLRLYLESDVYGADLDGCDLQGGVVPVIDLADGLA